MSLEDLKKLALSEEGLDFARITEKDGLIGTMQYMKAIYAFFAVEVLPNSKRITQNDLELAKYMCEDVGHNVSSMISYLANAIHKLSDEQHKRIVSQLINGHVGKTFLVDTQGKPKTLPPKEILNIRAVIKSELLTILKDKDLTKRVYSFLFPTDCQMDDFKGNYDAAKLSLLEHTTFDAILLAKGARSIGGN